MQLVMFDGTGPVRLGALFGEYAYDLTSAGAAMGVDSGSGPVPLSLRSIKLLLASGDKGLDDVHRAFEFAVDSGDETWRFPVAGVRLHAPITTPRKVLALAGNYAAHIREGGREAPEKERSAPQVFMKPPTTLIGPDEPIRLPGDLCAAVDYEGELAVVIGRRCFAVTPDEASHCIAGYVNFNDVSCRRLSIEVEREPNARTAFFDWLNGKWFDTFGPIGPALVTIDEVPNPQALQLQTRVNGEVRQHASTAEMIFGVDEIISWISRMMTLEPGDVIATGTPSGVGSSTGRFLQPGDVVEVEISGLGVLRNPVDGPTPERDT